MSHVIDIIFESLLWLGILQFHLVESIPLAPSVVVKIIFCMVFVYTMRSVLSNLFNLRIFFLSIFLNCLVLIIFSGAEHFFTSGKFIELTWKGYFLMKWITFALVKFDTQFINKGKVFETELLKGTRYLLPKV